MTGRTRGLWLVAPLFLAARCPSIGGTNSLARQVEVTADFSPRQDQSQMLLRELTRAPHPFGSERQAQIAELLAVLLGHDEHRVVRQEFQADVPNVAATKVDGPISVTTARKGVNLVAWPKGQESRRCVVLIGSHFDTKIVPGVSYVGANDSGSSTVGVVEALAFLNRAKVPMPKDSCGIAGVFFDGEEAVLPGWDDGLQHPAKMQDNTYGSRHFVNSLVSCNDGKSDRHCLPQEMGGQRVIGLVLLDMIGSPELRLSLDTFSTPKFRGLLLEAVDVLHWNEILGREQGVSDDHIPFLKGGIPAIDLIDFNHLAFWHREGDDLATIDLGSIARATRLGIILARFLALNT